MIVWIALLIIWNVVLTGMILHNHSFTKAVLRDYTVFIAESHNGVVKHINVELSHMKTRIDENRWRK